MPHFSEEELQELELLFGLKRIDALVIRDGKVNKEDTLWFRSSDGPQQVNAIDHWNSIKSHPHLYQFARPCFTYSN